LGYEKTHPAPTRRGVIRVKATLTVDPYRIIGAIDPNIYGQFLSRRKWVADVALYNPSHPDADESGLRRSVVEAIAASAPPIIRWPGGCTGTSYDWRDGIGPQEERSRTIDVQFGYDVGNGFGTAEFVSFCRRIGAQPHLNLSTGLGTLRDALEWVEYCNYAGDSKFANLRRKHGYDEPFNVRYWQIGNENYGAWEVGQHTPQEYATIAREWGKAIKKLEPALKVLAVGGSEKNVWWDAHVLDQAWPYIDYLSAHRYWNFNSDTGDHRYDEIAAVGYAEELSMKAVAGQIESFARMHRTTRRPKIAFTEWNCSNKAFPSMSPEWRPGRSSFRLVDALAVAGFINAMQRQCQWVALGSFAQSINLVGMLMVTEEHIVKETVYWPLLMLRRFSGSLAVDCWADCEGYTVLFKERELQGVPYIDASATLDQDNGRLVLSLVNRHPSDEAALSLRLRDVKINHSATLRQLYHENALKMNTIEEPDAVVPQEREINVANGEIVLPPHSFSLIEMQLG